MEDKKFDELLVDIEVIVKDLESGNIDLETSIEKYSEALDLLDSYDHQNMTRPKDMMISVVMNCML